MPIVALAAHDFDQFLLDPGASFLGRMMSPAICA